MQRREKGQETNLHFNKFPKVNVFWRGKTQSAVEMRWNFQISRKEQEYVEMMKIVTMMILIILWIVRKRKNVLKICYICDSNNCEEEEENVINKII